jgi:hypothetical protein
MKVITKERTNKVTLQNETEVFVEIKETLYFWGATSRTDKALAMIAEANKWIETAEQLQKGEIKK